MWKQKWGLWQGGQQIVEAQILVTSSLKVRHYS